MTNDFILWLRGLASKGGKGTVNHIDARCLGRIADDLERYRGALQEAIDVFDGMNDDEINLELLPRLRTALNPALAPR